MVSTGHIASNVRLEEGPSEDTLPKWIDREGLGKRRTATRKGESYVDSYVALKHLVTTTWNVFLKKLSQSSTKQSIKQYNTYRFKR